MKKWSKVLFNAFLILFSFVFLILLYYSTRYSIYLRDFEYAAGFVEYKDSILKHIMVLVIFCGVGFGLGILNLKSNGVIRKALKIAVMVGPFAFCIFWVLAGNFYPINDTNRVLECAQNIRNGIYSDLPPNGYVGGYIYQLGLISILNAVFFIFRSENYEIFQLINCCCVPIIVFLGDSIVVRISNGMDVDDSKKEMISIFFLISIVWCFPLLFYTPYVYGEVLSVTMVIAFVWLSFRLFDKFSWKYVPVIGIVAIIGYFARGNYLVLLVAAIIVYFIQAFADKKVQPLIAIVIACLMVLLASKANVAYYERISGIKIDEGVPNEAVIAMGLDEYDGPAYGWYGGWEIRKYVENGCDRERTKEYSKLFIHDRLSMFLRHVGTSPLDFYKEKMVTQWNDPTMNCLIETKVHIPETIELISETTNPDGKYFSTAVGIMNEQQFLTFIGALIGGVALLLRGKKFYVLLPLVYVFGGFLFTLIWEAMGRYVFPYFVLLQMIAPIGWTSCYSFIHRLKKRELRCSKEE